MFYIILLIYLKLEDLWLAQHKKGGGGEGDKSAKGKRERILFPLSTIPSPFSSIPLPFQGLSRRQEDLVM